MSDEGKTRVLITGGYSPSRTFLKVLQSNGLIIVDDSEGDTIEGLEHDLAFFDEFKGLNEPKRKSKGKGKRGKKNWESPYGP